MSLDESDSDERDSDTEWLQAVFTHAALGIALVDMEGRLVRANPALGRMTGYTAEELRATTLDRLTHPEDLPRDRELLRELLRGQRAEYQIENRYLRKDGQVVWGHLTVSLLRDGAGEPEYALAMVQDVTARKQAEQALESERAHLEELFECSPQAVVLADPEDRVLRINPEFTGLFGYTADEVVGRTLRELILPDGNEEESLAITRRVARGERVQTDTVRRCRDGSLIDVSVLGTPITLHGNQIGVYGIYQNIAERKALERGLHRLGTTDALTGLLNRHGFESLAQAEQARAEAGDADLLLFFIDLDDFKRVNDDDGHSEGDRLLQDVAGLLRRAFRASDLIARLGGDEFVVLAVDARSETERVIATRLNAGLEKYNRETKRTYPLRMSVGAHRAPASTPLQDLLAEADQQMYEQKRQRRGPESPEA